MTQFTYRLQPLLEERERTKKEAEAELARRERELEAQLAMLQTLQRREQELVEKREQLRRELLGKPGGTLSARELLDRAEFVKVVGVQIQEAQDDIRAQREMVESHQAQVQAAKARVEEARREVEVLNKHREKQEERFSREERAKEELALDEIGNVLFTTRRPQR